MHKFMAGLVIAVGAAMLGGCYYEPGYSYVRGNGGGDAYYGRAAPVYDDGYYAAPGYGYYGPGYYDGWGGGYYGGCCYSSGVVLGVGGSWRSGPRYRHGGDRRHYGGHRAGGHYGGYRGHDGRYDRPGYDGGHRGSSREGGGHPDGRGRSFHGHGRDRGGRHHR